MRRLGNGFYPYFCTFFRIFSYIFVVFCGLVSPKTITMEGAICFFSPSHHTRDYACDGYLRFCLSAIT